MSIISSPVTSDSPGSSRFLQNTFTGVLAVEALFSLAIGVVLAWIVIGESRSEVQNPTAYSAYVIAVALGFVSFGMLAGCVAFGLNKRRDWAISAGYVACAAQAIGFPVGTIIALFGYWVLSRASFHPTTNQDGSNSESQFQQSGKHN